MEANVNRALRVSLESSRIPSSEENRAAARRYANLRWRLACDRSDSALESILAEPDQLLAKVDSRTFERTATSVAAVEHYFLKRYNHSSDRFSKKLKNLFRVPPAVRAFEAGGIL